MMIGLSVGLDVPHVGQRQRHHLAGIEPEVGLLCLTRDAVEQMVDHKAVDARLGAGTELAWPTAVSVGTEVTWALPNHAPSWRSRDSVGNSAA